jgi:hypothetical protein
MKRIFLLLTIPFVLSGTPEEPNTLDAACDKYAPQEYIDANFILASHIQFSDCYLEWIDQQRD